jgi:hypothetical protein
MFAWRWFFSGGVKRRERSGRTWIFVNLGLEEGVMRKECSIIDNFLMVDCLVCDRATWQVG